MKNVNLPMNITKFIYFLLLVLGVIFYISWGILYDEWKDIGVYSITIIMIGFGLFGVFLYSQPKEN